MSAPTSRARAFGPVDNFRTPEKAGLDSRRLPDDSMHLRERGGQVRTLTLRNREVMTRRWWDEEAKRWVEYGYVISARVFELKRLGYLDECRSRKCSVTGKTITPVRVPVIQRELFDA